MIDKIYEVLISITMIIAIIFICGIMIVSFPAIVGSYL